ncbi:MULTISPECIES: ABC transporter ATP-binding protein [Bacillaceae]|uniref:ABC transporter ATP-binding protein n=1 Tax=Evansella alkalicola TaxID=745819 RepID=A0ABS6JZ33_9BACI|nr:MULTISPECIES: ABC transporter ATP-binding protein [Bacillaceae]MBU9722939.1 ABC transporter ATP-binding protein [Bacillus alkalicola]
MVEPIITFENLTKKYDGVLAVDHLSLTVERGEVFGLLGPNGAGKSTTILMMLGLTEPTSGQVKVCGFNSTREPKKVKERVGYLPDSVGFYEDRTGLENLVLTAMLNGVPRGKATERATRLLKEVGLEEAMNKKTGKYSRGMKQRLGLADVLIKEPDVIVLDEPTLGIDPQGVQDLLQLIEKLSKEQGITVLLSSHHLHQVQQICDRVGLFVDGKLLAKGTLDELSQELFSKEGITTIVKVSEVSDELITMIKNHPSVFEVEKVDKQNLHVKSETDVTGGLVHLIMDSGKSLLELSIKEYGLDEIYHQYFQGGGNHEAPIPRTT